MTVRRKVNTRPAPATPGQQKEDKRSASTMPTLCTMGEHHDSRRMRVTLGLGCDRGTSLETLQQAIDHALALAGLHRDAIDEIATIDKKSDEPAMLQLAAVHHWPLRFFSAEALARVEVPSPSETVRQYMGTPAVAEAAALLAANTDMQNLLLEKFKYKGSDGKNATVSIAKRSRHE